MHTKSVLCIFLLSGCYSNVLLGETKCGARIFVDVSENDGGWPISKVDGGISWDLDKFNKAEAKAFELFNDVKDDRLHNGCNKVSGLNIWVTGRRVWLSSKGKTVAGETRCGIIAAGEFPMLIVNSSTPHASSYAHELAHYLQDCKPRGPLDMERSEDVDHAGWNADGIYDALGWYWTQLEKMGY